MTLIEKLRQRARNTYRTAVFDSNSHEFKNRWADARLDEDAANDLERLEKWILELTKK